MLYPWNVEYRLSCYQTVVIPGFILSNFQGVSCPICQRKSALLSFCPKNSVLLSKKYLFKATTIS